MSDGVEFRDPAKERKLDLCGQTTSRNNERIGHNASTDFRYGFLPAESGDHAREGNHVRLPVFSDMKLNEISSFSQGEVPSVWKVSLSGIIVFHAVSVEIDDRRFGAIQAKPSSHQPRSLRWGIGLSGFAKRHVDEEDTAALKCVVPKLGDTFARV